MNIGLREQIALLLLSGALLVFTYTKPTAELEKNRYRFVYVFDISQSMNVSDVPNIDDVTRLELAKQAATQSLTALPCGSEIGVALFSGHRVFFLITPIEVCANYGELSTIFTQVDWRMTWERKSEIAKGIHKGLKLLALLEEETRLVFFTDGHEAPPLRVDITPEFDGEVGKIAGLVVGVGGATPVPIPKYDELGNSEGFWGPDDVKQGYAYAANANNGAAPRTEHLSSLREDYLINIANKTGLYYHRLTNIDQLFRELKADEFGIAKTSISDVRWLFALAALIVLVVSMIRRQKA